MAQPYVPSRGTGRHAAFGGIEQVDDVAAQVVETHGRGVGAVGKPALADLHGMAELFAADGDDGLRVEVVGGDA